MHVDIKSTSSKDFLSCDMHLGEKVAIPLSLTENECFMSVFPFDLTNSFLELSDRAFVLGKLMGSLLPYNMIWTLTTV